MSKTKVRGTCKMIFGFVAATLLVFTSCNESFESMLKDDYPEQAKLDYQGGKVIWIVLDGASGTAVKQANNSRKTNTIREMLNNSVYTFDGLAGTGEQMIDNNSGWANLMTGITDSVEQESAPSVFRLAKQAGRSTALYASTDGVYNKYGTDADAKFVGDDNAVLQRTLSALKADSVADFSVVEFDGVLKAGQTHGFYDEAMQEATPEVIDAVRQMDRNIAKIKAALEMRPKYNAEKWLVLVTSSFGGEENNAAESVYEMKDRNTFAMFYNSSLKTELLQKPSSDDAQMYRYYSLLYSGGMATEKASVKDASLFNFKYDPEEEDTSKVTNYTVQFMYYDHAKHQSSETMVSKADKVDPGYGGGWSVKRRYNGWFVKYSGKSVYDSEKSTNTLRDGKWHVLTLVFDFKKQEFREYRDGTLEMYGYKPAALNMDLSTNEPLTIGKIKNSDGSYNSSFSITNLQIYNVALPESFIAKNYKQAYIDKLAEKYKYWDNLIGYWPCDREEDYQGDVLLDYSKYGSVFGGVNAGKSDMQIKSPSWTLGASAEDNVTPLIDITYYQQVINNVDLAYQTFQWLQIPIKAEWNWEGIGRALPYNIK